MGYSYYTRIHRVYPSIASQSVRESRHPKAYTLEVRQIDISVTRCVLYRSLLTEAGVAVTFVDASRHSLVS